MAKNTGQKVQIAFYGTEQQRKKLKREALDRGVSVQDILSQAVAAYFSTAKNLPENFSNTGASTVPIGTVGERQPFAEGSEGLHMLLDFVYESGSEAFKRALEASLDALAGATQAHIEQHGVTRHLFQDDEEETESLLREARTATARAGRVIEGESEAGSENPERADESVTTYPFRRRA